MKGFVHILFVNKGVQKTHIYVNIKRRNVFMKKKLLQKIGVAVISGAMVVSALAGCGNNAKTDKSSTASTAKSASTKSGTSSAATGSDGQKFSGVKLVYWSNWEATEPQGMVIAEAVEAYEKETGVDIEVEFKGRKGIKEGLIPALDANQQVDFFDGAGNKSNYGDRIISLEDIVKEHNYEPRTNPTMMALFRSYNDGVLKEIPYQFKANAYLYNKKLFKQAGIEKAPANWDEFLAACQKLKDAGIIPLTTDDAYVPQAFGMHLGRLAGSEGLKKIVNENGWDRPEVLQTANDLADLAAKGYFSELVASNVFPTGQNTEFATGKVAMYCVGTYMVNEVKNITGPDFEWGFFAYPEVKNGINGTEAMVIGGQSFAITSMCKNKEAAFGFIEKMTRGEYDEKLAKESISLPADAENHSWPEQLADVKPYFDNCKEIMGGAESNPDITPALKENLIKLYSGKLTGAEFVENMKKAAGK